TPPDGPDDDDPFSFDPLSPSSYPGPLPLGPRSEAPISTTMGGTQRLQQVSPEHAALAREEAAREDAERREPARRLAPTLDMVPEAAQALVKKPADDGASARRRSPAAVQAPSDAGGPSKAPKGEPAVPKADAPSKPSAAPKPTQTPEPPAPVDDGPSFVSLLFAPVSVAVG